MMTVSCEPDESRDDGWDRSDEASVETDCSGEASVETDSNHE